MGNITEVALITLKAGTSITSDNGAQVWKDILVTLTDQPGYERCFYGTKVEDPTTLVLFVEWKDIESHKTFMSSSAYGPFVKKFEAIMTGVDLYHADIFVGDIARAARSAVVEFAQFYVPTDYDADAKKQTLKQCLTTVTKDAPKDSGIGEPAIGWGVEERDNEKSNGKAKVAVLLIGWDSVDAHMAFRELPVFKDNIGLLREGVKGADVCHVPLASHENA